jgi:hypothetical protein
VVFGWMGISPRLARLALQNLLGVQIPCANRKHQINTSTRPSSLLMVYSPLLIVTLKNAAGSFRNTDDFRTFVSRLHLFRALNERHHDFLLSGFRTEEIKQLPQWIVKLIHHALLQRNYRVIRDNDVFGTDFRTAFRDVAVTDSAGLF